MSHHKNENDSQKLEKPQSQSQSAITNPLNKKKNENEKKNENQNETENNIHHLIDQQQQRLDIILNPPNPDLNPNLISTQPIIPNQNEININENIFYRPRVIVNRRGRGRGRGMRGRRGGRGGMRFYHDTAGINNFRKHHYLTNHQTIRPQIIHFPIDSNLNIHKEEKIIPTPTIEVEVDKEEKRKRLIRSIIQPIQIMIEIPVGIITQSHIEDQPINSILINGLEKEINNYQCKEMVDIFHKGIMMRIKKFEKIMNEREEMFKKFVNENKKILKNNIEVYKRLQKKKKIDEFIIQKKTIFTPLLTHCYDVFEIIFTYLTLNQLLSRVLPACSFFYNLIINKIMLKVNLSTDLLFYYPIDFYLSTYKIDQIRMNGGGSRDVSLLEKNFGKLANIIHRNKNWLKKIDIAVLCDYLIIDPTTFDDGFGYGNTQLGTTVSNECNKVADRLITSIFSCKNITELNLGSLCFSNNNDNLYDSMGKHLKKLKRLKIVISNFKRFIKFLQENGERLISLKIEFNYSIVDDKNNINVLYSTICSLKNLKELRIPIYFETQFSDDHFSFLLKLDKLSIIRKRKSARRRDPLINASSNFSFFLDMVKDCTSTTFSKFKIVYDGAMPAIEFNTALKIPFAEVGIASLGTSRLMSLTLSKKILDEIDFGSSNVKTLKIISPNSTTVFPLIRRIFCESKIKILIISPIYLSNLTRYKTRFDYDIFERIFMSLHLSNYCEKLIVEIADIRENHLYQDLPDYFFEYLQSIVSVNKENLKEIIFRKKYFLNKPATSSRSSFTSLKRRVTFEDNKYGRNMMNETRIRKFLKCLKRNVYLRRLELFNIPWQHRIDAVIQNRGKQEDTSKEKDGK